MKRSKKTTTVKTVTTTTTRRVKVVKKVSEQERGDTLLKFGPGNSKLKGIWTFSLPAGHTCPQAEECLARVPRDLGKVVDGPKTVFRCHSASTEAQYEEVRNARWHNLDLLKGKSSTEMARLIGRSLPTHYGTIRVHVSGDFFSVPYLDAWLVVARRNPEVRFYGYTKSLSLWLSRREVIPTNFVLTASYGGREDALIPLHKLRSVRVVFSVQEAKYLGLEIDHDDSHAMRDDGKDFALLIHGTQPKGSDAAKAINDLRKIGEYGYGPVADRRRAEAGRLPLHMAN